MDLVAIVERMVVRWMGRDLQRRMLRHAALTAQRELAERHPLWHDSLFDEHFVLTWALPLLCDAADTRSRLPATVLAAAWAHRIGGSAEDYRRRQTQALPIAARYLQLVAERLEIEYHASTWRGLPDLLQAG